MKKAYKDTIDGTEVEFKINVSSSTKKGKKSTHPDMEDAPAPMITEWLVTSHLFIDGQSHSMVLSRTFYNEAALVDGLPKFEEDLFEKAAALVRDKNRVTLDQKLKKLGYE